MGEQISFEALLPPAMAAKAEALGVKKANLVTSQMFMLAVLAGAFISVAAMFATIAGIGDFSIKDAAGQIIFSGALPYSLTRLFMGLVFSLGLILVVVGGAELFTGNTLITMAFANKKITLGQLMRNWVIVYLGNFAGSILTVLIVFVSEHYLAANGTVGLTALKIGEAKTSLAFIPAVASGMMCNALVCIAVWLCYSARSTTDKILAIIFPISSFVAAGFEHSVANMYFIPMALFIKGSGDEKFFALIAKTAADFPHLTWSNFFVSNLIPVTIGNIIGGAVMVGLVYWFIYNREQHS
jgi:formate/nitrite transporter